MLTNHTGDVNDAFPLTGGITLIDIMKHLDEIKVISPTFEKLSGFSHLVIVSWWFAILANFYLQSSVGRKVVNMLNGNLFFRNSADTSH